MDLHDIYNIVVNDDEINFSRLSLGESSKLIKYNADWNLYNSNSTLACTLPANSVDHPNWNIVGKIHEDYYTWINDFYAVENKTGNVVFGNFEEAVFAEGRAVYARFLRDIKPSEWDYHDI